MQDESDKNKNNNNDIKINNENQELKNKDNIEDKSSSINSEDKNINDEIINGLLNKAEKNNELKFKINQQIDTNSLENIKQDIINFYLIEKQKYEEKKRKIEINKNYNYNTNSKVNTPNYNKNSKRTRPNSATKMLNKKNRFEKYDKEKISYEVYHQYQKMNFNASIPFIQRMELYSLKKCLKDYKIEELTNLQSPKISEKEIVQTFNRLIEDSNRRLCKSKKVLNKKEPKEMKINNKKKEKKEIKKSFSKKKWDEIYEKRFKSKLKERNNKLEKKRKEKEEKIKKEEDTIIDNLNKKQELLNQKYGMKRNISANNLTKSSLHSLNGNKYYIGNSKIVTNLNQRLYYNEIKKKDIYYKSFLEKAHELLDDNEYDSKNIKSGNKKNCFRKRTKAEKKKDNRKKNVVYNFIDFDENKDKKEEEKNNNNFNKIIKDLKDDSRLSETSMVHNSKIEITYTGNANNQKNESAEKIIDGFFEK